MPNPKQDARPDRTDWCAACGSWTRHTVNAAHKVWTCMERTCPYAPDETPEHEAERTAANLQDEAVYLRAALDTALKRCAELRAELDAVYGIQDELVSALERARTRRVAFLVPQ